MELTDDCCKEQGQNNVECNRHKRELKRIKKSNLEIFIRQQPDIIN